MQHWVYLIDQDFIWAFEILTFCWIKNLDFWPYVRKNYWFADVLICMQNELLILKITDVVVYIWLLRIIAIFLSNGPSSVFFLFLFGFMKYRSSIRRDLSCIWLIWLPKIWFWSRLNCLLHMLVLERAYYVKFCEVINLAFDTMTEKRKLDSCPTFVINFHLYSWLPCVLYVCKLDSVGFIILQLWSWNWLDQMKALFWLLL